MKGMKGLMGRTQNNEGHGEARKIAPQGKGDAEAYAVEVKYDARVPVRDGLELSANLFLPVPRAPGERFPAVLEMIPYRKDDWRFNADHERMTYLARRGFAGCRLDIRGTGSSPGVARDEYTPEETRDGYDAVEWLAAQPWCNGNVGMWGISYGGFTAIQVAMLQPPHLKAIVPMYATDDRYTDDVHYLGGCLAASEFAQYAVTQLAMNALPPRAEYRGPGWLDEWRERLEQTPPWLLRWLREQTDGPYWRSGSLRPDYERITCALFHIGGWADGYTNAALRMQARCVNAPRKTLIGNWAHVLPDSGYPGPNVDYLHEMARFFAYWLKGEPNGVMDEPALTLFRREYTPPEAFPARMNGAWHSEAAFPIVRARVETLYLGAGTLQAGAPQAAGADRYPHRPTLGTRGAICWGAGAEPNGLARDLRPDEALSLTYTSAPLAEALDVIGFPEVVLYLSATVPVAHVVVRLADVAPDGASAYVTGGILNLTHREGHAEPMPLEAGTVYRVAVKLKAVGYRFLPGHRLRLSVASASWPIIWPSPYPGVNSLHCGPDTLSALVLPVVPPGSPPAPPALKSTPPELEAAGSGSAEPSTWQIVEDVLAQTVTVIFAGGDTTVLPGGKQTLFNTEHLALTASETDPADVRFDNEVAYRLADGGRVTEVHSTGTIQSTARELRVDLRLEVRLDGEVFFERRWEETVPRRLL
jgi:putative CocE/NonD family hydrolase